MLKPNYFVPRWTKKTGVSLGAIALGMTALLVPGCTSNNEEIQEGRTNVTSEDVARVSPSPNATGETTAIDKPVTIRSEAANPIGNNSAFLLKTEDGQSIVAINATGQPFVLPGNGIPVQATGNVKPLVVADVEREYGLDLQNDLFVDYESKPAIIAKSLALAPGPEDLYRAPEGYFEKPIAIKGEVRKLNAPNAFALFEEGWVDDIGVLVVGIDKDLQGGPLSAIQEGEKVVVTGVTRNINVLAEKRTDLGWNDTQFNDFNARYTKRPVIVADGVYPSAVDK